jgi:hypothetical protein
LAFLCLCDGATRTEEPGQTTEPVIQLSQTALT